MSRGGTGDTSFQKDFDNSRMNRGGTGDTNILNRIEKISGVTLVTLT